MFRWALVFLVIAMIAAIFGFTNIIQGVALMARVIFFIFLVLAAMKFVVDISLVRKH